MRKRLLAVLLCLCMAATFLPGTALADGEGTTENPDTSGKDALTVTISCPNQGQPVPGPEAFDLEVKKVNGDFADDATINVDWTYTVDGGSDEKPLSGEESEGSINDPVYINTKIPEELANTTITVKAAVTVTENDNTLTGSGTLKVSIGKIPLDVAFSGSKGEAQADGSWKETVTVMAHKTTVDQEEDGSLSADIIKDLITVTCICGGSEVPVTNNQNGTWTVIFSGPVKTHTFTASLTRNENDPKYSAKPATYQYYAGYTPVESVTVSPETVSVSVGGAVTLKAEISPIDAEYTGEWSSSNENVATVSEAGVVTGVSAGTATITYTAASASTDVARAGTVTKSGSCTVTVSSGESSNTPDPDPDPDPTPSPDPDPDPSTPGSGGGSYTPPSSTSTETTKNPDGSTTTKTENKTTGTVTETTKNTDGSTTKVETKKDGTVTTTETDKAGNKTETVEKPDGSSVTKVNQKDGTKATVNTDTEGKVEAEVTLPKQVVAAAQENEQPIMLPVPRVEATASAETAPVVTVKTGSDEPVKVLIPTTEAKPGTVAVILKADGTEEIVKTSVSTADGLAVALPDGATVKVVDNSKTFADVPASNWAADAVSFSSARELFSGTSEDSFSPDEPMTHAMMVTVLARFDGADTSGGDTWYEKSAQWAADKGISDGSDLGSNISREQLAVMLWRYAGSPAPTGGLEDFHDAGSVSDYAQEAMRWAVESGIVNGNGSGALLPQGEATRAQVAQMLKNFIEMQ